MAHNCVDWTTTPPTRKIPLLVLTRGDDHVWTAVPNDLQTLRDVARREFALGDVDVHISTACVNRCNGLPARITESAWGHLSAYIGCATVEVAGAKAEEGRAPREEPPRVPDVADEHDASAKEKQPTNVDEPERPLGERPGGSAREVAQEEEEVPSDHERNHDRPITPVNQPEDPGDQEVSAVFPRKPRRPRHVLSEDEGEGDESEREPRMSAEEAPVASPPSKRIKTERKSDHRLEPEERPAEEPERPIKQEKGDGENARRASHSQPRASRDHAELDLKPQAESQPDRSQAPAESGDHHKLMIRVAHRPTKQESKFTTKSTTKVSKVLAGACKSFGLDPGWTTMYLIVAMEDEEGQVENLFPCDKNDTIARAGAERDTESRFLLKTAGEE